MKVPDNNVVPIRPEAQGATPPPVEYMMMAAAVIHGQGRLFEPTPEPVTAPEGN
jgi:hypothetical protein